MNDAQLLERLGQADAYASDTALPEAIWTPDLALREVERRMGMTDKTIEHQERREAPAPASPERPLDPKRGTDRRPWVIALAAAAIVLVVGLVVALLPLGDDEPTASTTTTTTLAPTTTLDPIAMAVAHMDRFFSDVNAGDLDAVVSAFATDADFSFAFAGDSADTTRRRELQWEVFAWNIGQGTIYEAHQCEATGGDVITLVCTTAILDAPGQVADLGGVPTEIAVTFVDGVIDTYHEQYTGQDFTEARGGFEAWINQERLSLFDFGSWTDVESARAKGETLAQHAADWAASLPSN